MYFFDVGPDFPPPRWRCDLRPLRMTSHSCDTTREAAHIEENQTLATHCRAAEYFHELCSLPLGGDDLSKTLSVPPSTPLNYVMSTCVLLQNSSSLPQTQLVTTAACFGDFSHLILGLTLSLPSMSNLYSDTLMRPVLWLHTSHTNVSFCHLQAAVADALRTSDFERFIMRKIVIATEHLIRSEKFWCQFVPGSEDDHKDSIDDDYDDNDSVEDDYYSLDNPTHFTEFPSTIQFKVMVSRSRLPASNMLDGRYLLRWWSPTKMVVVVLSILKEENEILKGKREIPTWRWTARALRRQTPMDMNADNPTTGNVASLRLNIYLVTEGIREIIGALVISSQSSSLTCRRRDIHPATYEKSFATVVSGVVVSLLASHLGETGSIAAGVAPGLSHAGIVPDDAAGRRVLSRISRPPTPASPFWRCSILTSFYPYRRGVILPTRNCSKHQTRPLSKTPSTSQRLETWTPKLRTDIGHCKAGPDVFPHPTRSQGRSHHGCVCPLLSDQLDTASSIKNKAGTSPVLTRRAALVWRLQSSVSFARHSLTYRKRLLRKCINGLERTRETTWEELRPSENASPMLMRDRTWSDVGTSGNAMYPTHVMKVSTQSEDPRFVRQASPPPPNCIANHHPGTVNEHILSMILAMGVGFSVYKAACEGATRGGPCVPEVGWSGEPRVNTADRDEDKWRAERAHQMAPAATLLA
ncbi:hypothetical protein PR048_008835 [Dryococelus australis]|uniref:Uncharacterized protein n=1 Tax=Dryococelus australis TaxID=614101 RepID=A0ABQ9HY81_9NEOP|nr:hypothetical protein PR048_008835 [Dryococelus australis]